ncbi:MAG: helix-turn-helix domain-containing protein [Sporomusaceae bacterium]|nr:helix-turn-helix domain-containing protein [Sporomusaceae bacterium]
MLAIAFHKRRAKYILNPRTQIHYAICSSYKGSDFPHIHDFYELFFIIKGSQSLVANGKKILLPKSSLTLIRPQDVHSKKYIGDGLHINVAFSKETMEELLSYLGDGFPSKQLLQAEMPPYVILNQSEKSLIQSKLENLNLITVYDEAAIKTNLRILLFELLTRYFANAEEPNDMPAWVAALLSEMKQKEHFTKGLPALLAISGLAHGYLCRVFKKYVQLTPTDYINDQRLNYASNLLRHTDIDIVNLALEAGFGNLSHFYHLFKRKFHTTPADYRRQFVQASLASADEMNQSD